MEVLIAVALCTWVVKTVATDVIYALQGQTPPRHQARMAKMKAASGGGASPGGGGFWRNLLDDIWSDRRTKRQARQGQARPAREFAQRRWADTWDAAEEKWQDSRDRKRAERMRYDQAPPQIPTPDPAPAVTSPRTLTDDTGRVHPEHVQYPYTVDGAHLRPRGRGPQPRRTPDGGLYFGNDPTDPNGTRQCPWCRGTAVVDNQPCERCRDRQEQRNADADERTRSHPATPGLALTYLNICPGCNKNVEKVERPVPGGAEHHCVCGQYLHFIPDPNQPANGTVRAGHRPTGEPMSDIVGDALTFEQVINNLAAIASQAANAMDGAQAQEQACDDLVEALEMMAASMTSQNAHPDTISGVGHMIDLAKALASAAAQAAAAAEALHAAANATDDTATDTDGVINEAAVSVGHVAEGSYYGVG